MIRTPFGRTGLLVSPLGFGAAPIGFLATQKAEVGRLLNFLLDSGVNVIDTAAMYRGSEAIIGETVGHRRGEFVLVSKCGLPDSELAGDAWSPTLIHATVQRSLKRLRTDHLDVMLLHSCSLEVLQRGEALGALVRAREAGKLRIVGYSGDNEASAWAAAHPEIGVVQTSVNIVDQRNIRDVLPACRSNDIGVMAKRPIANAAWKLPSEQPGMYAEYAKVYSERFRDMDLHRLGSEGTLAEALGIESISDLAWAEIALRFTLSVPGVHTAIVGTTSERSARANLEAWAKGPLPESAMRQLREAFDRVATNAWTGQT